MPLPSGLKQITMKLHTYLLFLFPLLLWGQNPILVAENTFKIKSNSQEVLYYGFAQGDKVILHFEETKNNTLKSIEISPYDAAAFFKEYKIQQLQKEINIYKTGIYQIKLINDGLLSRTCKVSIQRIPASEKTHFFNSTVYWKSINDTIHHPTFEKYIIKKDTAAISLVDQTTKISSKNALNGNKNHTVVDFTLPENTISWGYYIGVGKEGKEAYQEAKDGFLKSAVKVISTFSGYGAMAALGLHGINMFQKAQGGDNVKYWFIQDESSVKAFRNKEKFYQYKQGDVINDASQMKKPLKGKVYLGLQNDNIMEPIEVFVKVTAITVTETKIRNKPTEFQIKGKLEPYLKN